MYLNEQKRGYIALESTFRALVCKVGETPYADNMTFEKAKELMNGAYIETAPIFYDRRDLLVLCDEEGKLKELSPNFAIQGDYIAGNCVITKTEGGEFVDLSDDELTGLIGYVLAHKVSK